MHSPSLLYCGEGLYIAMNNQNSLYKYLLLFYLCELCTQYKQFNKLL